MSLPEVLNKYWELANLDPETTKGTITGQLKALDALYVALSPEPGDGPRPHAGVYRAAWMESAAVE